MSRQPQQVGMCEKRNQNSGMLCKSRQRSTEWFGGVETGVKETLVGVGAEASR